MGRYLDLPADLPPSVGALARRFAAGTATPYEQAVALEDHLKVGYVYDTGIPAGHDTGRLERFLFETRAGYCEQFAAAFAVMARSLGLSTRVAVGFTPGTYDPAYDVWRVTSAEAHAWPEVYLEGLGWTPFEPTPGRARPALDATGGPGGAAAGPAATPSRPADGDSPQALRVDLGPGAARDAGPPRGQRALGAEPVPWWWWWVLPSGVVLGLALPPVVKAQRRRIRRAGWAGDRVQAAWREALDRAWEAGLAPRRAETPLEFAGRVGRVYPPTGRAAVRLAELVTDAAYARRPACAAADEAWLALSGVSRGFDVSGSRWGRFRRRINWRSLAPAGRR